MPEGSFLSLLREYGYIGLYTAPGLKQTIFAGGTKPLDLQAYLTQRDAVFAKIASISNDPTQKFAKDDALLTNYIQSITNSLADNDNEVTGLQTRIQLASKDGKRATLLNALIQDIDTIEQYMQPGKPENATNTTKQTYDAFQNGIEFATVPTAISLI